MSGLRHRIPQALLDSLPPPPAPVAKFLPAREVNGLVYLSGLAPVENGEPLAGQIGAEIDEEEGRRRARLVGLALLSNLRAALGDLQRVREVIKLNGYVNAPSGFTDHPRIVDGCSEVFIEAFGEAGKHARTAVGVASLPGNISVEIEAIVAVT
ncbi:RidA family protein [Celeribacter indicus]|uniref:Endoribonuclease L-PSP n=1 Tax=Celeribacter indicus TaxID=1208324 RepID=A0A0B5DX48_9RHOB|nr:RidA family protein [Celeribacter indicus]AJE47594.1 endoribonuclease L-PSP [Celeribacter indicus]SDW11317.1 Enamine deaminase RidA, house cleaning of reactive enamine intermediates, YjgF/YER057c/UK114 family [Celeribacter indicus]